MPKREPRYVSPSLESITVRGKYKIPQTNFKDISNGVKKTLGKLWNKFSEIGESVSLVQWEVSEGADINSEEWGKHIKDLRSGIPVTLTITTVEHYNAGTLVEVECRPSMWYRIARSYGRETSFTENEVQEALLECRSFVKQVMSIFRGKEVEPVSVYPIIQRGEIKSRLLNLGLKKIVNLLDEAEKHIIQNNFTACLKSSRTAFEKMIDWEMKKRGLEQTNNYKNDLERLKSKGYLGSETTRLLQSYYRCLSIIAVHEKGEAETGIYEAQMGYGTTLIMLDYFANKLP